MGSCSSAGGLACCHGYSVAAGELEVGHVETPLFAGALSDPEFLLVRTSSAIPGTFRIVPAAYVLEIDEEGRRLALVADAATIARLPERLPLTRPADWAVAAP